MHDLDQTLLHMSLVGSPSPLDADAIERAQARDGKRYPRGFITLLETFGCGLLLGRFRLLDPTRPEQEGGWDAWATIMAEENPASGMVTRWYTDDWDFGALTMFAVTPEGGGLAWRPAGEGSDEIDIWYLDAPSSTGRVHWLADSLQEAISRMIQSRFLGEVGEVLAPSPGGGWGFPPVFLASGAPPLGALIEGWIEALRLSDEDEAEVRLDHALGVYAGYDVSVEMIEALTGSRPRFDIPAVQPASVHVVTVPIAPELMLSREEHIERIGFALRMHRAYHPEGAREGLDLVELELRTRDVPRVIFETGAATKLSARPQDAYPNEVLLLDVENVSDESWCGELQITEFDGDGDPTRVRTLQIELASRAPTVLALEGVTPSARVDLELLQN